MIGLEILIEFGAQEVHIIGDSQLVLRQLTGEYKCNSLSLAPHYTASTQLLDSFHYVDFECVPRFGIPRNRSFIGLEFLNLLQSTKEPCSLRMR